MTNPYLEGYNAYEEYISNPYEEGWIDYLFGKFLHDNPYIAYGDSEIDQPEYYQYYDGWMKALECYPELEPKEE